MLRAADLARRLGQEAEAVCRAYLPNGRRQGRYWLCGDVMGTPGRSMYVLLSGERAGKWTDSATSQHGDLLDLIALNRGLDFRAALDEARHFLSLPTWTKPKRMFSVPSGSPDAARRLFAASKPIRGTLAEAYLQSRGIILPTDVSVLHFHPRCFYRSSSGCETWPALIAAVTDIGGNITGAHRTWLDPQGGKAPVDDPRRAMGCLVGNGVRFGVAHDVLTAAEGIETALALKTVMPDMPIIAALSAAHLSALILPPFLHRLYVACDNDEAGLFALERLRERLRDVAIDIRALVPKAEDFNADLLTLGADRLRDWLAEQLASDDSQRFVFSDARRRGAEGSPEPECAERPDWSPVKRAARTAFPKRDLPAPSGFATAFGRPPLRCGPRGCKAAFCAGGRSSERPRLARPRTRRPTMTLDIFSSDSNDEPHHSASPTAHLLDELQTYGCHPHGDEPDPRPMPEPDRAEQEIAMCVEALAGLLTDTPLEDDLNDVLWSFAYLFHRKIAVLDRTLDDNEQAQRRSQQEQDGSEVKSVELERLTAKGLALIERRNAFEAFRDIAAAQYETLIGSAWRPRSGSFTNRKTLTAAVIDSRDFIAAKRRAEIEPLLPVGPRIAFTGGIDFNDHIRIWAALDKALASHPGMVLLHGGSPKGAERAAACWADNRKVPQIVFKPDWTRHKNAAPFKRNDALLEALPIGLIAFPGSGISQNLADKARKMGIPVWRFDGV